MELRSNFGHWKNSEKSSCNYQDESLMKEVLGRPTPKIDEPIFEC